MQQEYWIADRATLQRLLQLHPEWTQEELANWIGRSKGWVVQPLVMVDNSNSPCELVSGRFYPYSAVQTGCFIL